MGKPMLMGRKTWESLGKPLAERRNIVLSHSLDIFDADSPVATSSTSANDFWPGAYAHTRIAWKFSKTFDVGVDLRGLFGPSNVSLIGPVRQGNYVQWTIGLGIHQ